MCLLAGRIIRATTAVVAVAAACVGPNDPEPTACTRELRVELAPRDTAIAVGVAFTPAVALSSCGGRERLTDTFAWAAADTAVVRVDAATGRTTGRAPGETRVEPTGQRYGWVGAVRVTVRAAP